MMVNYKTCGKLFGRLGISQSNVENLQYKGYVSLGPYFDKKGLVEALGKPEIITPTHWHGNSIVNEKESEKYVAKIGNEEIFFLTNVGKQTYEIDEGLFISHGDELGRFLVLQNNFGFQGMTELFHFGSIIRSPSPLKGLEDFETVSENEIKSIWSTPPMFLSMENFCGGNATLELNKRIFKDNFLLSHYHAKRNEVSMPEDDQSFIFVRDLRYG